MANAENNDVIRTTVFKANPAKNRLANVHVASAKTLTAENNDVAKSRLSAEIRTTAK